MGRTSAEQKAEAFGVRAANQMLGQFIALSVKESVDGSREVSRHFALRAKQKDILVEATAAGGHVIRATAVAGDFEALQRSSQAIYGAGPFTVPVQIDGPRGNTSGKGDTWAMNRPLHL